MSGFAVSLTVALFRTIGDLTTKLAGKAVGNAYAIVMVGKAAGALILGTVLGVGVYLASGYSIHIGTQFLVYLVINAALNGVAFWSYVRAYQLSDVSKVAPITLFTPVFLLITSPLMLGQQLAPLGVVGVLGIVIGAYRMGMESTTGSQQGVVKPLTQLFSDSGVRYMLLTAFLWSITSNVDRLGVAQSSPILWIFAENILIALGIFTAAVLIRARNFALSTTQTRKAALPGVAEAIGSVVQMYAITIWPVLYVIAVKRMSTLFSVVAGKIFFNEKNFAARISGVSIMLAGAIAVIASGY